MPGPAERTSMTEVSYGAPSIRPTIPPASETMSAPAAMSHGFRLNSKYPSYRPEAT